MTEWEYKEDNWISPLMPKLERFTKREEINDKTTYVNLKYENGRHEGILLGKNGYPEVGVTRFELDGLAEEDLGRGYIKRTNTTHRRLLKVVPLKEAEKQIAEWESKLIPDFTTWLGHHSKEGWEIFKISRAFNPGRESTWCVFRRKI